MTTATPITDRLDDLHDQWVSFVENPDARILVWQARGDETPLIEAFVAKENDDAVAETPDFFLRVVTSFENPPAHGYALREELIQYYDQISADLRTEGLDATWKCPHAEQGDDDIEALLRALTSLHRHHAVEDSVVSVWLDPAEVKSEKEYLLWLQRVARRAPSDIRFIVVDSVTDPSTGPLLKVESMRIIAAPCDLDMPGALVELSEAAYDKTPTPGAFFRTVLAKLAAAIAKQDLIASLPLAEAALRVTETQGWPHLGALVHMMLGAAYAALGQPLEAIKAYTEADRLGQESEKKPETQVTTAPPEADGAPHGGQLRLFARLGQGATLISCGAWKQAAEVYLACGPLAASIPDPRSELDAYRLASVCLERAGEVDQAWNIGLRGMQLAETLDDATRRMTTLAYLGDHLIRLTESHTSHKAYRAALDKQFTGWLGKDWRPKPTQGAAA